MLVLDERQQGILMTLKQSMTEESNNKHMNNKINNVNDKLHSNIINHKDVTMNKINCNTEVRKPERKEIWYVNFGRKNGSIQSGIRPCIIGSNPVNNKYSTIRNVYPITSKTNKKLLVHVEVEGYGLTEKSLILTEQITTIDIRYDLISYVGTVSDLIMKQVDMARNIQLGDLQPKSELEKLPQHTQDEINETLQYIYSYEKVLGMSQSNNLNHLLKEKSMLLEHLEKICNDNRINYREYYIPYTKERNVAVG